MTLNFPLHCLLVRHAGELGMGNSSPSHSGSVTNTSSAYIPPINSYSNCGTSGYTLLKLQNQLMLNFFVSFLINFFDPPDSTNLRHESTTFHQQPPGTVIHPGPRLSTQIMYKKQLPPRRPHSPIHSRDAQANSSNIYQL